MAQSDVKLEEETQASNSIQQPPPQRSIYELSSQYRHWRFSPEQLAAIRRSLNEAAVGVIRDTFENDEPGSSQHIAFLTADEEHALVKHYITKVSQLCGHFRFPDEVEATAITYLKRFYLKNTVMDWHPKNVMLTALFLSLKTTNNAISLEDYTSRIPKTAPADVLDLEFLVAQSLGFEFAVWHAHRALWGMRLDIQTLPNVDTSALPEAYESALSHLKASRLADAELIYTPSQIALTCFACAAPDLASAWASAKGQSSVLNSIVPDILAMMEKDGVEPALEVVKQVDKRLKICKNPEKVKGSKAWLKRQKEVEEAATEKRMRKAEEARKAMEDDPFGGKLDEDVPPIKPIDDDDDD
ncbi:hypothetical protein M422DRAFT_171760 [Sphaerobolus stellatus SS14]|uniref:Cyclin-like domain-containing protein n=1 Tax=Sphaerobolus stellatus (strain SS14) TaxID=990650 RepID=A0A0C9VK64_SPHS4|nr:hypothetical protein M422DRAFT_171760 [Sphaerobolus stellatus SS14]